MSESKKAAKAGAESAQGSICAQAIRMIARMRQEKSTDSFEERLSRVSALMGDGTWLLKKESMAQFHSGFAKGKAPKTSFPSEESPKRVALENYLLALGDAERDAQAWHLGLMALLRCGVLEKAPRKLVAGALEQAVEALAWEGGQSAGKLARELFRNPAWVAHAARVRGGAAECFVETLNLLVEGALDSEELEEWREVLTELLDAAELWPGLDGERKAGDPEGPKACQPGWALMNLAKVRVGYGSGADQGVARLLGERARQWIKEKRGWPEPGEMAAELCHGIQRVAGYGQEAVCAEGVLTLKVALAQGMGVRRAEGEQPLKILMGAAPGKGAQGSLFEAGQALLDAGASEMDLMDGLEGMLKKAANRDLEARLRVKMERRELSDAIAPEGFGPLSREEMELVAAFRRQKAPAEPASPAGPSRKRPSL